MSALPPKTDMDQHGCDVRFVPKADILHRGKRRHSIDSSARGRIQSTSHNPLNTGVGDLDLRNWGSG